MSWFWQPRNTWEKSRPLIPSGWSSLPPNFSDSATPRNSASRRNSRKSSLYTTSTRIPTHGGSHELSRNFTQKLPFEDIIMLFFFFQTFHIFVHAGMCTFQRNIYFGTHNGQWILFQIKWFMWLLLPCIYCNASNSWSKLVLTPVSTCIWWAFDLRSLGLPMQFLSICCMKVLKRENVFIYVLENIWKKIVKSAGYMPNIPAVLKFCHFFFTLFVNSWSLS